jgi:hypothetical protein
MIKKNDPNKCLKSVKNEPQRDPQIGEKSKIAEKQRFENRIGKWYAQRRRKIASCPPGTSKTWFSRGRVLKINFPLFEKKCSKVAIGDPFWRHVGVKKNPRPSKRRSGKTPEN